MPNHLPTLGFLGCGAITTAMVTGFCDRASDVPYPIIVSDMNAAACNKLQEKFPKRVSCSKALQDCVDRSDWFIIASWPQAGG